MAMNLNKEFDKEFVKEALGAKDLSDDFEQEYMGTPPKKANWSDSAKASDPQLSAFKKQLEPTIGAIESIKRVLGRPEVVVACLAIGTCVLYKIVNGNLLPFTSGGKSRRKKRNKKRTLRRKSK